MINFFLVFSPHNRFSNLQQVAHCFELLPFTAGSFPSSACTTLSRLDAAQQHLEYTFGLQRNVSAAFRSRQALNASNYHRVINFAFCDVWIWAIDITGTILYQRAKASLTASYRQLIVEAAGIQNATASCFFCGSNQKKQQAKVSTDKLFSYSRQMNLHIQGQKKEKTPCHKMW